MTMRNRKTVIVAFLVVAVMLMAVGFAALTDNLIIAGEANANTTAAQKQWEDDIYFTQAEVKASGTSGIADKASVGTSNNDHANYEVNSLARANEIAVFEFTITNAGNTGYAAKVTVDSGYPTISGNAGSEDYYTVTYEYDGEANADNFIIPAGESRIVKVTVMLKADPDQNLNAQFTLNLTATSVN